MGKNKANSKKKLNVFKVAGGKSLKAKTKARPVTGNLRKIKEFVRKNVKEIDKQLKDLESSNDVRKNQKKAKPKPKEVKRKPPVSEKDKADLLLKMSSVKF